MKKVRWGLVSTAHINRKLIPAIRASERGELVAVSSRGPRAADAYAKEWDIPMAYGNYQAMLNSGAVDAVYISLPNHMHAEWTVRAIEAGLHVLCEKPFATTLEDVDRMIAASKANDRVLAEAFMYRHHPQTRLIGRWVEEGRLGDVTMVRGVFNFPIRKNDRKNIRLLPEYGGGGLWDVGVYPISLAQFIFGGPPEWVFGEGWFGETGVDETFSGMMGYSGGEVAQISCSLRSPYYTQAEIIGTDGTLISTRPFNNLEGGTLTLLSRSEDPKTIDVETQDLYLGEVEDMNSAILDGKPTYISLEETRDHVRTVKALYLSAAERRVVDLNEIVARVLEQPQEEAEAEEPLLAEEVSPEPIEPAGEEAVLLQEQPSGDTEPAEEAPEGEVQETEDAPGPPAGGVQVFDAPEEGGLAKGWSDFIQSGEDKETE